MPTMLLPRHDVIFAVCCLRYLMPPFAPRRFFRLAPFDDTAAMPLLRWQRHNI